MRPIDDNGKPNGKYFLQWKDANDFCDDDSHDHKLISAYTAEELMPLIKKADGAYIYQAFTEAISISNFDLSDYIMAISLDPNIAAKMLLYLKKEGLVTV